MNKVKVVKKPGSRYNHVNDIHSVTLCLLDKKKDGSYVENGNSTTCKDYIGDSIAYQRLGFVNGGTYPDLPISTKNFCFAMVTFNKDVTNLVLKQSKILNTLERKLGIPETRFYTESDYYVVVDADKFWIQSTLTTSILVQIIRSLIYSTTKRRVSTHIKECLTKYTNKKDTPYWANIVESKVSLEFLLENIKAITNGSPFTACDDEYIMKKIPTKNKQGEFCFLYGSENIEATDIKGNKIKVKYYKGYNHGAHGISSFCDNLKDIKNLGGLEAYKKEDHLISFKLWAINYYILKEGL